MHEGTMLWVHVGLSTLPHEGPILNVWSPVLLGGVAGIWELAAPKTQGPQAGCV